MQFEQHVLMSLLSKLSLKVYEILMQVYKVACYHKINHSLHLIQIALPKRPRSNLLSNTKGPEFYLKGHIHFE